MKLNEYTTLGRTGLRVTPLCFGAMNSAPAGAGAPTKKLLTK